MSEVENTLKERGSKYGVFKVHADITQSLKCIMNGYTRFEHETDAQNAIRRGKFNSLTADKQEALDMIAHKIGRILNGDPEYRDSWIDIAGYAQLVADTLKKDTPS